MADIVVTESWPIVLISCPGEFDTRWVDALDAGFVGVFARREPFAIITDTTRMTGLPGARERARVAEWANKPEHLDLQKKYCVGSATILKSAVVRGTLQAIYWLYTPPAPQFVAKDVEDAFAWCLKMLDARGVALPAKASELRRIVDRELGRSAD